MNRERLDMLIGVMRRVADAKLFFDMATWVDHRQFRREEATACGTSACAFGYAALDPAMQTQGLHMELHWVDQFTGEVTKRPVATTAEYNAAIKSLTDDEWHSFGASPTFGKWQGFDAAERFFGISERAARYLFDPPTYDDKLSCDITPEDVIERIETVIAAWGDCPAIAGDDEDEC